MPFSCSEYILILGFSPTYGNSRLTVSAGDNCIQTHFGPALSDNCKKREKGDYMPSIDIKDIVRNPNALEAMYDIS
jgi:hypothetical protein